VGCHVDLIAQKRDALGDEETTLFGGDLRVAFGDE
jgi:hypothetical protein